MKSRAVRLYLGLVVFSLAGSVFARLTNLNPEPIARPTAILTLLVGCYAAFEPIVRAEGIRAVGALAAVWAIGTCAEVVGIATGFPFGRYEYTDRWWPTMQLPSAGNFPLMLPLAWVLVVCSAYLACVQRFRAGAAVAAAGISTVVDQAMEPAMTRTLNYWHWIDTGPMMGGTPVSNAVGWLGVSFAAAIAMRLILRKRATSSSAPLIVLIAYVLMVLTLGELHMA